MAEQEPTAEQLAQIAAENEEDEHSVNYKPPAQKSIQEIQELDKDDESLRKYKEALLGAVTVTAGEPWDALVPWSRVRGRRGSSCLEGEMLREGLGWAEHSKEPLLLFLLFLKLPWEERYVGWCEGWVFESLFLCLLDPNAPNVVVTKLTLVCATAPGPLELDLTGELGTKSALPGQSCFNVGPSRRCCQGTGGAVGEPSCPLAGCRATAPATEDSPRQAPLLVSELPCVSSGLCFRSTACPGVVDVRAARRGSQLSSAQRR